MRISIASPQDTVPIDRARLRAVALAVLEGEGIRNGELSIAFVDNATIRTLNERYLKHAGPTDVLSFPLSDGKKSFGGELVIGAEVAQEEAQLRGHDVHAELALYIIHGTLHLCGYEDKDARSAQQMRERERFYLRQLGLPDIAPTED